MKKLSKKCKYLKEALTLKINERAHQLKKEGKKVFFFSIGEPDFHTPDFIKEKGIEAIKQNFTNSSISQYASLFALKMEKDMVKSFEELQKCLLHPLGWKGILGYPQAFQWKI